MQKKRIPGLLTTIIIIIMTIIIINLFVRAPFNIHIHGSRCNLANDMKVEHANEYQVGSWQYINIRKVLVVKFQFYFGTWFFICDMHDSFYFSSAEEQPTRAGNKFDSRGFFFLKILIRTAMMCGISHPDNRQNRLF